MADSSIPVVGIDGDGNPSPQYSLKIYDNGDTTYSLGIHDDLAATEASLLLLQALQGGEYNTGPTDLTNGDTARPQLTAKRAARARIERNDGTEIFTDASPAYIVQRALSDFDTPNQYSVPSASVNGSTAGSAPLTDTTSTPIIAAQGTGVRMYVTAIVITNGHPSVGTRVEIRTAATRLFTVYAAPAGGGVAIALPKPLRGGANEAINAVCITTGASVDVSLSGYASDSLE